MIKNGLFTNEIVFRGHPDKICDAIGMKILHYCLAIDPTSRVGIDGCGGKGVIFLTGEVRTGADLGDWIVEKLTRKAMIEAGMTAEEVADYKIINNIGKQSPDIAQGVEKEDGAGDQGFVVGYAERNGSGFDLPIAMWILQQLSKRYSVLCKIDHRFKPDGKAQITGEYKNNRLIRIKDFTIAYQNTEEEREDTDNIIKKMASEILELARWKQSTHHEPLFDTTPDCWHINATGKFLIGGFEADAGEIGRKIVCDQTQGFATVGGGNLNGKDPSKVDFSGVHVARKIAQRYLQNNEKVMSAEVQIGYVIGENKPTNVTITAQYLDDSYEDGPVKKEYTVNGSDKDYADASVTNCKQVGMQLIDKLVDLAAFGHCIPEEIE